MNNEKLFGAIPILACVNLLRCLLLSTITLVQLFSALWSPWQETNAVAR